MMIGTALNIKHKGEEKMSVIVIVDRICTSYPLISQPHPKSNFSESEQLLKITGVVFVQPKNE
jgi:hypothetical protein